MRMARVEYPFLELTVLPPLRRRFLAPEPALLFSGDIGAVLWANAPGANLLGGGAIGELANRPLSPGQPLVRQIAQAAGQLRDGEPVVRSFKLAHGLKSELVACELSRVRLPAGEAAVLLVAAPRPAAKPAREHELALEAARSLAGFADAAAIIDEYGLPIAATDSFAEIETDPGEIGAMIAEAAGDADRLVKRAIVGAGDARGAIGIARLRDKPKRYLLVCLWQAAEEEDAPEQVIASANPREADLPPQAVEPQEDGAPDAYREALAEATPDGGSPDATRTAEARLDRWYFGFGQQSAVRKSGKKAAAPPAAPDMEPAPPAPEDMNPPQSDTAAIAPAAETGASAGPVAGESSSGTGRSEPIAAAIGAGRKAKPVRFAFHVDADQVFRSVSPELAQAVGVNAADIVGRSWADVARVFGFDPYGDIRRLLAKRDTWSGKTVLWPIQGTDLVAPVDLAALPAFNAARQFEGFRGFGVIRAGEAVVDKNATGVALVPGKAASAPDEAGGEAVEARRIAPDAASAGNASAANDDKPGGGAKGRVVELASRKAREAARETDRLSRNESQAFSEIARTLGGGEARAGDELAARGDALPDHRRATTDILAQLPAPVLVYRNGETLYANDELLRLSRYDSAAELAAAGGMEALLGNAVEGGPDTATLRRADGTFLEISPLLKSVPWEGGKALLLTFRQKQLDPAAGAERAAIDIARVAELQNILNTAADGVIVADAGGRVESVNAPAEALFGIDFDPAAATELSELFAFESHKAIDDYMDELAQPGLPGLINDGREVIGREKNGGLIPLFVTMGRMGESGKYCVVLRDMTQWKKAEEELVKARRAAEVASEQKSDFLARVSHEIRTPLNAIIGFSDVMIEERFGPVGNERYREYLRDINRSGAHVLDLVNDLLDISKIEAGKMEMSFEAVDLNQIAAETVALLQPQANRDRIIIRTSLSRAVPKVVADARSIRQIILNLVSNAIKFTPENGQVIVSTVYEGNGEVALRVRDTGRGMSEAEIERAMKPFQQVGGVAERRGRGTGLGLPLTKAMVEANRAYFALESKPGEGTIAHVHFPSQRVLAD
jgi:PAS domain S-box-containing protein